MPQDLEFDTLLAFAAGELTGESLERVRRQIAARPDLQRIANLLTAAIATLRSNDTVAPSPQAVTAAKALFRAAVAAPGVVQQAREWLARRVFDSRLTPALGFRSASQTAQLSFESERGTLELQIDPADATHYSLVGQIGASGSKARGVSLWTDTGAEADRTSVDEHGMFILESLAGRFELRIEMEGGEVLWVKDIEVR